MPMATTKYDRERWVAAHHRFLESPFALTDEDLEQLALTDPRLAERGRAKRAGFVEAEDDFVKEHGHHPLTLKLWSQWLSDLFSPMLEHLSASAERPRPTARCRGTRR